MPFDEKTGREAGKKSKRGQAATTKEVKQMISDLVEKLHSEVIENIDQLEAKEKAELLTKLVEYVIPKQKHTFQTNDFTGTDPFNKDPMQTLKDAIFGTDKKPDDLSPFDMMRINEGIPLVNKEKK